MNVVPMFLNVFVPWGVFILCCGITSFWVMYAHPTIAWGAIGMVFTFWGVTICTALFARRYEPDPTWFTFTALVVGIMAVAGTVAGVQNFNNFSKPYFEIQDLKVVQNVDASFTPGKNVMDGGIFLFGRGNHLDESRSWHFKLGSVYCVAPIITNGTAPLSQTYDFWAIGKDCCSVSASDFRCGSWGTAGQAGGIRLTASSGDLKFYGLAVQQAESLYDIMAPHPIFLTWSAAPAEEVSSWNQQVFKNYLLMVTFALVCSMFLVTIASCSYAWIGRGASAYDTQFNDNPDWKLGGYQSQIDYSTKRYVA